MSEGIDVTTMMTDDQRERLALDPAWSNMNRPLGFPLGTGPFQQTGHFHAIMGLSAPEAPIYPSVSMRERRLRLVMEEFLELVEACGFEIYIHPTLPEWRLRHVEGSRYDVVECADALGDLNVVVNGTAVEFGIPMHFVDYEVYCSNLSKLPLGGQPIVNHCRVCGPDPDNVYLSTCACESEEKWLKPGVPIGKILKPDSFVPTNIPRVLLAYQNKEI